MAPVIYAFPTGVVCMDAYWSTYHLFKNSLRPRYSGLVMNDIAFVFFAGLCNLSGSESVQNFLILAGYSRANR